MANTFKNAASNGVGLTFTAIGGYVVPASTQVIIISGILANVVTSTISVTVAIYNGSTIVANLVKNAPILAGGSIILPKIVLIAGQSIQVQSNVAASLDATIGLLERT